MKLISSKDNSKLKKIKSLSVKKYREQFALYKLEGIKVIKEALSEGAQVEDLLIDEAKTHEFSEIISQFDKIVSIVPTELLKSLSETESPQGIIAVVKKPEIKPFRGNSNSIILDGIQDPGNLGTIIRSSVASGFRDIILIDSVDPYSDKVIRSTSGTIFKVNFYNFKRDEFVSFVKTNPLNLLIADMDGESIFSKSLKVNSPVALVVGSEGKGVSDELMSLPHRKISIPMEGKVESLNAGVSASVIMFVLKNEKFM